MNPDSANDAVFPYTDGMLEKMSRNRLIDYLRLISSFEAQIAWSEEAYFVYAPMEFTVEWDEWDDIEQLAALTSDIYSDEEILALRRMPQLVDAAVENVKANRPAVQELDSYPAWRELRDAAAAAAAVFDVKGKLSIDYPVASEQVRALLRKLVAGLDESHREPLLRQIEGLAVLGGRITMIDLTSKTGEVCGLPDGPLPVRAFVTDFQGTAAGELIVWLTHGRIDALEYAWWSDDQPLILPDFDHVVVENDAASA